VNESAESLIAYCRENSRVCPVPQRWNALWELLPDRKRVGGGWEPALPLILAARLRPLHRHRLLGRRDTELKPQGPARLSGGSSFEPRGSVPTAQSAQILDAARHAQWWVGRLAEDVPTLVGIEHGFSFPLRYFEVHHLAPADVP